MDKGKISFYSVPLVCGAAPKLGCGSKAKPVLLSLESKKDIVAEAWLNRPGTVAIVWQENSLMKLWSAIADSVFSENTINVEELIGKEHNEMLKEFEQKQNWYRAAEVDKLSLEEADIIAARLVKRIHPKTPLSQEKMQSLKTEFANVFKSRFTQSYTFEINGNENKAVGNIQQKREDELLEIGKKYLSEKERLILKDAIALGYRPLPQEETVEG